MGEQIRVAIVEDDLEIRTHLAMLLENEPEITCKNLFHTVKTALASLNPDTVDVILLDISLPGTSGIEGIPLFREKLPDTEIIMLTIHQQDQFVFEALCAGASGFLTKFTPSNRIISAIKEVHNGGAPMSTKIARMVVSSFRKRTNPNLSKREKEVLNELCDGKSYKMVADALNISRDTVRSHIRNIYKKLEVNSKSEAVAKALKNRLV